MNFASLHQSQCNMLILGYVSCTHIWILLTCWRNANPVSIFYPFPKYKMPGLLGSFYYTSFISFFSLLSFEWEGIFKRGFRIPAHKNKSATELLFPLQHFPFYISLSFCNWGLDWSRQGSSLCIYLAQGLLVADLYQTLLKNDRTC